MTPSTTHPVVTESKGTLVRPFRVEIPKEVLEDLRRRIAAMRWPERELVPDQSQGVQLATMQALARYRLMQYDFRRVEARLDAFPQFMTEIDGNDIHFIHVRSPHENALPLIMTHGAGPDQWSNAQHRRPAHGSDRIQRQCR